jgi:hypothetical protein
MDLQLRVQLLIFTGFPIIFRQLMLWKNHNQYQNKSYLNWKANGVINNRNSEKHKNLHSE